MTQFAGTGSIQGNLTGATQTLTAQVAPYGEVAIQLSGTFAATVQFEATLDNATWVSLAMTPSGGGSAVTSATGTGLWNADCGGYLAVRTRCSAFTSGSIGVALGTAVNTATSIITVSGTGALTGDGSSGDPLAVGVDGVTIHMNGSNQLAVISAFDPTANIIFSGTDAVTTHVWTFNDTAGAIIAKSTGQDGGPAALAQVFHTVQITDAQSHQGGGDVRPLWVDINVTSATTPTDDIFNYINLYVDPANSTAFNGVLGLVLSVSGGLGDVATLNGNQIETFSYGNVTSVQYGGNAQVYAFPPMGATVAQVVGYEADFTLAPEAGGEIALAWGAYLSFPSNQGAGTISTAVGLELAGATNMGGGVLGNVTGLKIGQMTVANATSYTIDANASTAPSRFGGTVTATDFIGPVKFPTSDPHLAGAWWNNAGTLVVSAG